MSRICVLCNRTWRDDPVENPKALCRTCISKFPGMLTALFDFVSNKIFERAGWLSA